MNTIRAAILVALAVNGVTSNDLQVGSNHGRIVFNETVQASPAIWRQSQQVAVNVSDHETISGVIITDHRPDKDGEAKIVNGGEGQQNVTIELKSPTVFRGFDFHVVVYATLGHVQSLDDAQHPAVLTKDFNTSKKPKNKDNGVTTTPKTQVTEKHEGPNAPAITGDVQRIYRNTQHSDPIVKFVTEKTDNLNQQSITAGGHQATHDDALKVKGPIIPLILPKATDNLNQQSATKELLDTELTQESIVSSFKANGTGTVVPKSESTTEHKGHNGPTSSTPAPSKGVHASTTTKAHDVSSTTAKAHDVTSTTAKAHDVTPTTAKVHDVTTEKTHEEQVQHHFDNISKELGQKVVLGFKKF